MTADVFRGFALSNLLCRVYAAGFRHRRGIAAA